MENSSPNSQSGQNPYNPRIYVTYKSKNAIISDQQSPQHSNIFEKTKRDRKLIQDRAVALSNRVQLLEIQEKKTQKKIFEQQKLATSIQWNQSRVQKEKEEKQQRLNQARQQLIANRIKIQQQREQTKLQNAKIRQELIRQKQLESQMIRQQSNQNDQRIRQYNNEYQLTNHIKRKEIQTQYSQGNERILDFYNKKKQEVQMDIKQRVEFEQLMSKELQRSLQLYEQEEAKQFDKLSQTKQAELKAKQQLEQLKEIKQFQKFTQSQEDIQDREIFVTGQIVDPQDLTQSMELAKNKGLESSPQAAVNEN